MLTGLAILLALSILIGVSGDVTNRTGYGQTPTLQLRNVQFDPPSPAWEGSLIRIRVEVENTGGGIARGVKVGFTLYNLTTGEESWKPPDEGPLLIKAKDSIRVEKMLDTEDVKLGSGAYELFIEAEGAELSTPLVLKEASLKPDLYLRTIGFPTKFPSPLNPLHKGKGQVIVRSDLINIGGADAGEFKVLFSYLKRGETEFEQFSKLRYTSLKRGTPDEVKPVGLLDISDLDAGVYIIKVEADSEGDVVELDEGNNRQITSIFIADTERIKWSFPDLFDPQAPAVGAIESSPLIGDGTIYIGSNDGNLYAINALTGREREWSPYATGGPIRSSPSIERDDEGKIVALYFGSDDGHLYAVDPDNGQLLWDSPFLTTGPGAIRTTPAIGQNGEGNSVVYFGSDDRNLYALFARDYGEKKGGTQKWSFLTGGPVRSSPAVADDGTLYFGSDDGYLYALNPDGTERWRFLTGGPVRSSLGRGMDRKTYISPDGTVYFGSDDGNLYAVNIETPTEKWKFRTAGPIESTPLVKEEDGKPVIYFGSFDGHLYAVRDEGNKGTEEWQYPKENGEPIGSIKSSPAIGSDGTIYFGSDDGNLYALEDDGKAEEWIFPTAAFVTSSPAIGDQGKVLYAGSWDGHLYAIDLTIKP